MRREQITYHLFRCLSSCYELGLYNGNHIFAGNKNKSQLLDYLEGTSRQWIIRRFDYCVLDNHFLVLENSSGRMSDFVKL